LGSTTLIVALRALWALEGYYSVVRPVLLGRDSPALYQALLGPAGPRSLVLVLEAASSARSLEGS